MTLQKFDVAKVLSNFTFIKYTTKEKLMEWTWH